MSEIISIFVLLWAVIDPIGTVPVFLAVTRRHQNEELTKIAIQATLIAAGILIFFIIAGQFLLEAMSVPLAAFQVSGGLVLFAFAFNMVFGESKPEEELRIVKSGRDTAIFPLAVPAIAGPGAMMAVVLMTDKHRFELSHQLTTTAVLLSILAIQLLLLLIAPRIGRLLGDAGASVISRVMGIILAAVAMNSVLVGIKAFFQL
ncbi:MarC family protein [Marinobacterium arenosum]|uniref:MarC family protein n=1 Tax=Marinobacterium arenosum TaxID=2862496 RepID=UPI001C9461E1|nr:MarC family protein [Marinobacterium arenosum]MBY4677484.1 MarC family protein [Marinobacterium arenosum]